MLITLMLCCRDALKRQYNLQQFYLEVSVEDVAAFDDALAEKLKKAPTEHIPLVGMGAGAVDIDPNLDIIFFWPLFARIFFRSSI